MPEDSSGLTPDGNRRFDGRADPHEDVRAPDRRYDRGFEEDDCLRSTFMRSLLLRQETEALARLNTCVASIPRTLVRYWHDPEDLPEDVEECLRSWDRLEEQGFQLRIFDDVTAAAYIREHYRQEEEVAFSRCRHPAMRSDYFRMCFILREGGFYVDADDVLIAPDLDDLVADGRLKLQPLCYDIAAQGMAPAEEIWLAELPADRRIFYVNNDPLVAPACHPILAKALSRATALLLAGGGNLEIQSTTGPGNLTASLVAHARELEQSGHSFDFHFLRNWKAIAETRWDLSYRGDARNWRNMTAEQN